MRSWDQGLFVVKHALSDQAYEIEERHSELDKNDADNRRSKLAEYYESEGDLSNGYDFQGYLADSDNAEGLLGDWDDAQFRFIVADGVLA